MRKIALIFNVILLVIIVTISVTKAYERMESRNFSDAVEDDNINYREKMMELVEGISAYAKEKNPDFEVISQNTEDILLNDPSYDIKYMGSIDAVGREDTFFGIDGYDTITDQNAQNAMITKLNLFKNNNKPVFSIDYCSGNNIKKAQDNCKKYGYVSFAAESFDLNTIPEKVNDENSNDINTLNDAKNFLYVVNPDNYKNKNKFLRALKKTNYDVIVIDCFFNSKVVTFSKDEIEELKTKKNGGKRLVLSYMSIGESEGYRYYFDNDWKNDNSKPSWILYENKNWSDNYIINYWDSRWHHILYGNDDSYVSKIIDSGFDGVYLDVVDAYYYFE
ncbi:endo alpha-1,4 polygalactosaminidase [Clostridium sp. BJN0001]|uniref:endo alpha-1,4 polygalactosaminidase n=1 Tax=Clostridium sp. BJN0001 TaxID=2930219 RepID=UPI001FCF9CE0|nr:endo alpha-1,4 polygalactosaminidase [Clostridium sp. BJN0001]